MAESLGELYVNLAVRSQGFGEQLAQASESVGKAAQKIKDVTEKVGSFFNAMAATSAGLVAVASQSNARVGREVERLKGSFTILAEEVSTALLPAIRSLSNVVTGLVAVWRGLSPEARAAVSNFATFASTAALVSAALGKTMSLVEGLAVAIGTIGPALLGALPALAVFAVTAGVLVLMAGAFYKSWNAAGSNVKKALYDVASFVANQVLGVVSLFATAATSVTTLVGGMLSTFAGMVVGVLDGVTAAVRTVSGLLAPLAGAAGLDAIATQLERVSKITTGDVLNAGVKLAGAAVPAVADMGMGVLGAGINAALAPVLAAKQGLEDFAGSLEYAADGAGELFEDAFAASGLKGALGEAAGFFKDLLSGKTGQQVAAEVGARDPVEVSTVGAGPGLSDEVKDLARGKGTSVWQAFTKTVEEQLKSAAEALKKAAEAARSQLADRALGSLGALGSTISNAVGAAAAGPFAVVASVLLDLATNSEQFKRLMEVLNGAFQAVANSVGELLPPLMPLVGAIGKVAAIVAKALEPIFRMIGEMLQQFAPALMVLGMFVAALVPIFEFLAKPLMALLKVIGQALFPVLKVVAIVVLTVAKAIGSVWNGILGAITSVLRVIGKIPWVGDAADALADKLDGLRVNTAAMGQMIRDIKDLSFDGAMDQATQAAIDFGRATSDVVEELNNVPDAWRRALRVAESQNGQQAPQRPSSSQPPPATPPPSSSGTGDDEEEVMVTVKLPGGQVVQMRESDAIAQGLWKKRAPPKDGGQKMGAATPAIAGGDAVGGSQSVTFNIYGYDLDEAMVKGVRKGLNELGRRSIGTTGVSTSAGPKPYTT